MVSIIIWSMFIIDTPDSQYSSVSSDSIIGCGCALDSRFCQVFTKEKKEVFRSVREVLSTSERNVVVIRGDWEQRWAEFAQCCRTNAKYFL